MSQLDLHMKNPLQPFLEGQGYIILDGGLATELEARGYDLSDDLWSARLLQDAPQAIKQVHYDYLKAGADCVISASYQATIPGFLAHGLGESQAVALLERSVHLALEAREEFWAVPQHREGRLRPVVAASVGPYGAYLADGSEYTGDYEIDEEELLLFHRRRWHLLAGCQPDLLACETIPSAAEGRALSRLLLETPQAVAWFSFSCRDEKHVNDGTPLVECLAPLDRIEQIVAMGINCTAPRHIPGLVREARRVTEKPIVVYPNSGERYDVSGRRWLGQSVPEEFAAQSREWRAAGATLIGGCCRTGPGHIQRIRAVQQ